MWKEGEEGCKWGESIEKAKQFKDLDIQEFCWWRSEIIHW